MSRNSFLRDSVCAVCWVEKSPRSKSLSEVTTRIQDIIKLYIYDGYDKSIMSFPNVICGSCKRNLYLLKSGHTSRGSWGLQVAKIDWANKRRSSDPCLGVTVPTFSEPKVAENVCSTCFLVTGRGISHQCTQAAAVDNLIGHCLKLGEYAEQIASAIIFKKMESEGIEKGTFFKLKTRGTPISIRIEAPNLKSNRSRKQLSLQTVMELQVSLELSDNATKKLCYTIRTGLNRRDSVEENIFQKLENLKEQLDEFYSVEQVEFISNQNEAIIRDLAGFLLTEWDGFDLWLKKHYMIKRGYHGVGRDANNANKILKLIDELQLEVQLKVPYLLPVIQSLRTFKSVKEACFGRNLDSDSEHKISLFKDAFLCLQETAFSLGKILTVSWKIHIICCHVFPFVKHAGCGLSKYVEQCGEAIHGKFKPTWQRYKCNIGHKDYGDRLKTAVVDFGIKRL